MTAYWRVTEVSVIGDHAIRVRFMDGIEGVVRFLPDIFRGVFSRPMRCTKKSIGAAKNGGWRSNAMLPPHITSLQKNNLASTTHD